MPRIGVFGAMASGKSTVSNWFRDWGAALVEGDRLGWETLARTDVAAALTGAFGPDIVSPDGSIDRGRLGSIVFGDPRAMERLNEIVQPPLLARVREALNAASGRIVILDAALLTTWRLEPELDGVVEVSAEEASRVARLRASRGGTDAEARARIRGQHLPPVAGARRHWFLRNDGDRADLRRGAEEIWREIERLP
jgi:dephospho-CoA kinase